MTVSVHWVTEMKGKSTATYFEHPERLLIGRGRDCDLILHEANVEKRHAALSVKGAELVVEDLQSTNGTYLGGRRIREHALKKSDTIEIGGATVFVKELRTSADKIEATLVARWADLG